MKRIGSAQTGGFVQAQPFRRSEMISKNWNSFRGASNERFESVHTAVTVDRPNLTFPNLFGES